VACLRKRLERFETSASLKRPSTRTFFRSQNFPRANGGIEALDKQHHNLRKCVRECPEADACQLLFSCLANHPQEALFPSTTREYECQKILTWSYLQNFVHHRGSVVLYHKQQSEVLHIKIGILALTVATVIVRLGHTRV
jgi:hypothetical protein